MQPKPENSLATVTGGITLTVKKQDGTEESVRIRQVPVKEFDAYLAALDNEPKLVSFLTGKPAEWVDTLPYQSFKEIVTKGEELNATDFFDWLQRKFARMDRLAPGLREKLMAPRSPVS